MFYDWVTLVVRYVCYFVLITQFCFRALSILDDVQIVTFWNHVVKLYVHLQRGASNSKFLNYINKHLLPVFDQVYLLISKRISSVFVLVKVEYCTVAGGKYLITFADVVLLQLPEGKKLDLLKNLAESTPFTSTQDARQLLPSILQLLKVLMPKLCKTVVINIFIFLDC